MIVPFGSSAHLLAEKVGVKTFKFVNQPRLSGFYHVKERSTEGEENRVAKVREAVQKYDPRYKDQIATATSRLRSAKHRLSKYPDSKAMQATVKSHETALAALRAKATKSLQDSRKKH
jgi:hypothetical protein